MGHLQSYRQVVRQTTEHPSHTDLRAHQLSLIQKGTQNTADVPLGWKGSSATKGKAAFNKDRGLPRGSQFNLGISQQTRSYNPK